MQCAVLNTGKRVISQTTLLGAIGRKGNPRRRVVEDENVPYTLPPFLAQKNLIPFITEELRDATTPILYMETVPQRIRTFGFDAKVVPLICDLYLNARDAGALWKNQQNIVRMCDQLMRGLARVGIVALVDEATGYQEDRAKDELYAILEAYIAPELMPWTRKFPNELARVIRLCREKRCFY